MSVCQNPDCENVLPPNVVPGRARKWCSARCRKAQYGGYCECGKKLHGSAGNGPNVSKRCVACHQARRAEAGREKHRAYAQEVTDLWNSGFTSREIAAVYNIQTLSARTLVLRLRSEGWPLEYRRPQNVIESGRKLAADRHKKKG